MTDATLGIGTKFRIETVPGASPLAFTEIPEVLDIPELTESAEFVEATNQDSANFTREYIPGLIDAEEFTIEMNYLPASTAQTLLRTRQRERVKFIAQIVETTASPEVTWQFECYISAHSVSAPVAGKKIRSVTVRRTGPVTNS